MSIANRLKQSRIKMGLSQGALARAIGISRSAVSQWEAEDEGMATPLTRPNADNLLRCAAVLRVDVNWLQLGIKNFVSLNNNQYREEEFRGTISKMPVLYTSRDIQRWARSPHTFLSQEEINMPNLDKSGASFAFKVNGSAMINRINPEESVFPGEYAVINKDHQIEDGDIVLAEFGIDDLRLRQYREDGAYKFLCAFDKEIKSTDIDQNIKIIGKLTSSYRERVKR